MDTTKRRFVLFLTIFKVLPVHCDGYNGSYVDQLNSFRREVREDLYYIESDISTLFDTVKDLKKPGIIAQDDPLGAPNKTSQQDEKYAVDCRQAIDEIGLVVSAVVKALESEKRLNCQLQNKLQSLELENQNKLNTFEDALSDIALENRNKLKTLEDAISDITIRSQDKLQTFEDALTDIAVDMNIFMTYMNDTIKKSSYCYKAKNSGAFDIYIPSVKSKMIVYCDTDIDGGGWIVIMRRQEGSVDFDKNWDEYKNGFGNIDGEFWMGNDLIHTLTKSKSMELRIDMEDYDGNKAYAKYSNFEIGPEAENYILYVGGYRGTAGDSLVDVSSSSIINNGMTFSTRDTDNDRSDVNCAGYFSGGWWFNACSAAHLTGRYGDIASSKLAHGIIWSSWTSWDNNLKYVDMKIR